MKNRDEIVTLDLDVVTIARLALSAHEKDMKLNDFIVEIISDYLNDLSQNNHPELLIEKNS